ncbi:rhodanese-like domain-containing protein [Clostridium sp. chh4-2]|uniref:rhodanese-like domain-containing protein n=1 Tax=Clostridium sp. chh4-2 TaxID=2067550 RepID=UPI0026D662E5
MNKKILMLCVGIAAAVSLAGCASGQKKDTVEASVKESSLSKESMAEDNMTGKNMAEGSMAEESMAEENMEAAYHKITAEEAKKMMDEGGVTVVDVRRADEYAAKHIPGAILVPNESIKEEQPEALPDKDAVLLIHCRTGIRSKDASDKLVAMGYKNVYDFGGINDWTYETETGEYQEPMK